MSGIDGLDRWTEIGAEILRKKDEKIVEEALASWIAGVAAWISAVAPNSGLQAEWFAHDPVGFGTPLEKAHYHVRRRLGWLKGFPTQVRLAEIAGGLNVRRSTLPGAAAAEKGDGAVVYVHPGRITELRQATGQKFSTARLVRLCEELNACMATQSYLAAIMLLRAIIDHVPPIFGCKNFDQVISQTNGRSLQPQLVRLDSQARDVADRYLHGHIGSPEGVPQRQQIDFRSELDALLGEVVARLR